jgi:hypothetical protein
MVRTMLGPRKQRTRQHVIADLAVHFLEGFILEEGHTARRLDSDYSYDLIMNTFDHAGYAEPGPVYFQVKASETLHPVEKSYVFDVDIRDYNLWIHEEMPVVLVLFDAVCRRAYWLAVQRYFDEDEGRQPKHGAKTVRVRVPGRQRVNRRAIQRIRELRAGNLGPRLRGQS